MASETAKSGCDICMGVFVGDLGFEVLVQSTVDVEPLSKELLRIRSSPNGLFTAEVKRWLWQPSGLR